MYPKHLTRNDHMLEGINEIAPLLTNINKNGGTIAVDCNLLLSICWTYIVNHARYRAGTIVATSGTRLALEITNKAAARKLALCACVSRPPAHTRFTHALRARASSPPSFNSL